MGLSEAISISEERPTRLSTRCRPRHIAQMKVSPGAAKKVLAASVSFFSSLGTAIPGLCYVCVGVVRRPSRNNRSRQIYRCLVRGSPAHGRSTQGETCQGGIAARPNFTQVP